MSWTDEKVDMMKKLWSEGLSASHIAARLGDVTRNAVISKIHRSGLGGRIKPFQKTKGQRHSIRARRAKTPAVSNVTRSAKTNAPVSMPKPVTPYVESKPRIFDPAKLVTFADLDDKHCRFPVGDPRQDGFAYCGELRSSGLPYCPQCAAVAYQPPRIVVAGVNLAAGWVNVSAGYVGGEKPLPAAGEAPAKEMEAA